MYALANVTMSSNYNVANMLNDGMRILSLDELDFISGGGAFSWGSLARSMVVGGVIGGFAAAAAGPGIGAGIVGGALLGGAAYLLDSSLSYYLP